MNALERAKRNLKRARTNHVRQQAAGERDMSPRQTLRMYHAAEQLRRAAWALATAERDARSSALEMER